ncbi:MAG TPA: HD domain-containing phosphohydrolase [Longimicrobium sp.]|uniref:HD domain-containing phosphohydrolase n=1 Tax=Longimicrobium sp. TaxID=2029185 RepID=UPI002ED90E88
MTANLDTLLDRATAHERAGSWTEAFHTFESAYQASLDAGDAPALLESVVRLGHCHRLSGQRELAQEVLELALTLGEMHGNAAIAGRALNGLGVLAQDAGELVRAAELYQQANLLGRESGTLVLVGDTEQNLGILANIRGDLDEALQRYQTALSYLEQANAVRGRLSSLNNLGMLHVDMGRLDQADEYFTRALRICEEVGDIVHAGVVHINRAELFLARGERVRAREACDEGFEIFSRLNDEQRQAEALKFYGVIYRESGKLHLATIHLQRAIGITRDTSPLLEAEVQREMARVLRQQGRNRQALEALNRSHALFTSLQARPDLADIDSRVSELEEEFLSLVRFWGESIEAKDRYTLGHCARVADYACRIAERAGMTDRELTWFRMGAFLHDVGKTEVPEEILNKPGRLTDEERATMERHTVIGDEMLAPVEFPWDIRPMVRSHHERWDGRGYPDQLAAEAIPRSARILRLADVFDALTTARSYRAPLTPEQALGIMRDDQGSFDPELFQIFLALYDEFAPTAAEAASSVSA